MEVSFHTDDSFEPICDGPMICPIKPDCIPLLDFESIPDYVTSSEEDEEEIQEEIHHDQKASDYEQSMKYIKDFYERHQAESDTYS